MLLAYRANFVNSLISSFLWGGMSFVTILLLTTKAHSIFGWSREEIILLTASYNVITGLFHAFFSSNFERFAAVVNKGDLDYILAKPVDSQFLLTFWHVGYTSFIRIVFGLLVIIYLISLFHFRVNIFSMVGFVIFGVLGISILYSVWLMFSTLLVWYPQITNILGFLYEMNGITRFPPDMYRFFSGSVFILFLPLMFVIAAPVRILIERAQIYEFLGGILSSLILLFISRIFWKFALKHYSSASS